MGAVRLLVRGQGQSRRAARPLETTRCRALLAVAPLCGSRRPSGFTKVTLSFLEAWAPGRGQRSEQCPLPREELQSVQRELEVLSEQYSQKCLENAHLAQALEAERQALRQCQRENQELNAHNQVRRPGAPICRRLPTSGVTGVWAGAPCSCWR